MAGDDAETVARFLCGERDAVALVDGWISAAAAPFRRGLAGDWDDLRQEVRLEALELLRAGRYRGESSLKTYLWRVAAHTCLDALRRKRRRPMAELESLDEPLPSSDPSPLERVLEHEDAHRLLSVLAAMSSDCRELWGLILKGLSYKEIALRLGVADGALRVRAHRCRKRAAEALGSNVARASGADD